MFDWLRQFRHRSTPPPPYGLLDRRNLFVGAVYRSLEDPGALDEAAAILHSAELRYGVGLGDPPGIVLDPDPEAAEYAPPGDDWVAADWDAKCLLPFLGETHLLIFGHDFQWLALYDRYGFPRGHGTRAWAHVMAEWARTYTDTRAYLGRPSKWDYVFFTDSTPGQRPFPIRPEEYDRWLAAVSRVIGHKTAQYGWTFSPRLSPFTAREMRHRPWVGMDALNDQPWPHPPDDAAATAAGERLAAALREFVVARQLGRVYPAGTTFWVAQDPDSVLTPACAFISRRTGKPPQSRVGWIEARPDLVIEVRSRHDLNRRLEMRLYQWRMCGVDQIWVYDTPSATLARWIAPGFPPPQPPVNPELHAWLETRAQAR